MDTSLDNKIQVDVAPQIKHVGDTPIAIEDESSQKWHKVTCREADIGKTETKPAINIVLLGKSGVGKSTFINALCSYMRFNSLQGAIASQSLTYCIPAKFSYIDDDFKVNHIQVGERNTNEQFDRVGQSTTQAAKHYDISFGDDQQSICIIDTPGMGDTRGIDIDKRNYDETIDYLARFTHLNAICFLIEPNASKLHPGFRYCFKELLVRLPKHVVSNICFCFTNTRATQYRPGETAPVLSEFLSQIAKESNVVIPFEKANTFCFDNESFRYLTLLTQRVQVTGKESDYTNSWNKSVDNVNRLLDHIKTLPELNVQDLVLLNDLKQTGFEQAKQVMQLVNASVKKLQELNARKGEYMSTKAFNNDGKQIEIKIENIREELSKIIKISACIAFFASKDCIGVFNDDMEAYLDERTREEDRMSFIIQRESDLKKIFQFLFQLYVTEKRNLLLVDQSFLGKLEDYIKTI